ncbi:sigma 54-interacting transcriptional regulator [Fictibacillus sp. KIGAM418]|uniref:HTH-type transcriptional regulatory protein TyrR n=1 Tax=Fictibacillus marinisediminis TaxID=2878389 RepID=A0A9X2BF51_9BACL|nr:sigma 54-interacting transcriptional regulator [Fictibacillus marinisediminis]MCK6259346.1 sigma 54-interacting transcriptional regulator [Fictibacillus marinisediminis]
MKPLTVNKEILESVFSSMSNGVIVVDHNNRILFINSSAQKLIKQEHQDLVGKDIRDFVPNSQIHQVLNSGKSTLGAKMTIAGLQCMVNKTPLYKENQLIGAVSVIQDISQIEHYRSLLKQMEKIIEFSTDGIYVVNSEGITLIVNSAYEAMSGIKRERLIGHHMGDLMNHGYFDQSVSLLVLQDKKRRSILQRIGQQKDVMVTGTPVFNESGEIQMVVTSVRDITQLNELTNELKKAKSFSEMSQNRYTFSTEGNDEKVVFQSIQMKGIIEKVKQIASYPTSILLSGPSGAGKEVIANLVHQLSDRKDMPFIKVNCGAIPEQLLESELFGYEKGAFTGARQEGKVGLLELADKGTVLLDEVGELPLSLQVKLLRVLQEKQIQKLGSSKVKQLDIRIISATNKHLKELVEKGKFREDLYYRLQVIEIAIPPLSQRPEDIEVLLDHFFTYFCKLFNIEKHVSPETKQILQSYHWPGNVRELRNLVESMIVSVPSLTIEPVDLPPHFSIHGNSESVHTFKQRMGQFEKRVIMDALHKKPSIRKAAEYLGVDHSTLVKKMKKWDREINRGIN